MLEFVPGEVALPPLPAWYLEPAILTSIGRLLRRYHEAVAGFGPLKDREWCTELADPDGGPIICHNDVCPENVVFRDGDAVALLDFDFAAPGRALWDAAMTARMCVPVGEPRAFLSVQVLSDPLARIASFTSGYGLSPSDAEQFVDMISLTSDVGDRFVRAHVAAGDPGFVEMWNRGYEERTRRHRKWITEHRQGLVRAVAGRHIAN